MVVHLQEVSCRCLIGVEAKPPRRRALTYHLFEHGGVARRPLEEKLHQSKRTNDVEIDRGARKLPRHLQNFHHLTEARGGLQLLLDVTAELEPMALDSECIQNLCDRGR